MPKTVYAGSIPALGTTFNYGGYKVKELRQAAKKIYKAGFFKEIELKEKTLIYKDCFNNIYSIQFIDNVGFNRFYFRIGHADKFEYIGLTYKSDYTTTEKMTGYNFVDHYKLVITDNPDFILRASLSNLLIRN